MKLAVVLLLGVVAGDVVTVILWGVGGLLWASAVWAVPFGLACWASLGSVDEEQAIDDLTRLQRPTPVNPRKVRRVGEGLELTWEVYGGDRGVEFRTWVHDLAGAVATEFDRVDPLPPAELGRWRNGGLIE